MQGPREVRLSHASVLLSLRLGRCEEHVPGRRLQEVAPVLAALLLAQTAEPPRVRSVQVPERGRVDTAKRFEPLDLRAEGATGVKLHPAKRGGRDSIRRATLHHPLRLSAVPWPLGRASLGRAAREESVELQTPLSAAGRLLLPHVRDLGGDLASEDGVATSAGRHPSPGVARKHLEALWGEVAVTQRFGDRGAVVGELTQEVVQEAVPRVTSPPAAQSPCLVSRLPVSAFGVCCYIFWSFEIRFLSFEIQILRFEFKF